VRSSVWGYALFYKQGGIKNKERIKHCYSDDRSACNYDYRNNIWLRKAFVAYEKSIKVAEQRCEPGENTAIFRIKGIRSIILKTQNCKTGGR